jgi:microcystin-dependent protein
VEVRIIPYGAVTNTTFKVPDFRGKTLFGASTTDSNFKIGMNGGSSTKTLGINEIPNHTHSYQYPNDWNARLSGAFDGSETVKCMGWGTTYNTSSVGGGQSFSLLNPYSSINFIIKY